MLATLVAATVLAACPQNLANGLDVPASAKQLITVETPSAASTHATVRTWVRSGACWQPAAGPYAGRVGRNGVSANRREGDGTTPAGTFRIGATMYGVEPNPGVRFRYRRLRCGDWWVEDPRSPAYNTFQHVPCGQRPPFRIVSNGMWQEPTAYAHLAVIEFNMRPVVPGRGSGIFLHVKKDGPTNGCVSIGRAELVSVLRWLRPGAAPRIAIGTTAPLRRS